MSSSVIAKPPLRPLAPKPTSWPSSTTTRSVGLGLEEVVGGPEPRVAAADDRDVGGDRPGRAAGRGSFRGRSRASRSSSRSR